MSEIVKRIKVTAATEVFKDHMYDAIQGMNEMGGVESFDEYLHALKEGIKILENHMKEVVELGPNDFGGGENEEDDEEE